SFPACPPADPGQSSSPCSPARWQKPPYCFFQVCVFASSAPSKYEIRLKTGWLLAFLYEVLACFYETVRSCAPTYCFARIVQKGCLAGTNSTGVSFTNVFNQRAHS